MHKIFFAFFFLQITFVHAQKNVLHVLTKGTRTNLRGLSIAGKNTIAVSGNQGMTGISTDCGVSWKWQQVNNFEKNDFRDIHAFDKNNMLLMSIDTPAYILKTTDGAVSWHIVYENHRTGMFLDAFDFFGNKGIVVGDPIDGKIFLATTSDSGNSWKPLFTRVSGKVNKGEAFFASSGANIVLKKDDDFYLASGGMASHFFTQNQMKNIPIMQGAETCGANAIASCGKHIAIAGGDFTHPQRNDSCFCFSNDGGKTWHMPSVPPNGYRSDVIYINEKMLYCCGLNGIDVSEDGGETWRSVSKLPFNTCRYNKALNAVFFAGPDGCVAKIQL